MNTQHLKYAIEVGKTGSITQAAENLYIGQPSLSKALKELEESLGITIFKRTSKGAVPTAQGERFLVYARDVLRQVDKMESLRRDDHLTAQLFHVCVPRVPYINEAVRQLIFEMDPQGEMDIRVMQTGALKAIQQVADGVSELAVIRYPVRYERYFLDYMAEKKIRSDLIGECEPQLLMHRDHPLARAAEIRAEDLQKYPMVTFEDEGVPYLAQEEMEERVSRRSIAVSDSLMLARALLSMPTACGWCGDVDAEMASAMGLALRTTGCLGRMRDAVIYSQDFAFRNQDRQFIDAVYIARNKMLYGFDKMLEMESQT